MVDFKNIISKIANMMRDMNLNVGVTSDKKVNIKFNNNVLDGAVNYNAGAKTIKEPDNITEIRLLK
jgi:hypothetical protein